MEVVTSGQPGPTAQSDPLGTGHLLPGRDLDGRQVRVERLKSHAVVQDDAVAVDAQIVGMNDCPVVGRRHRSIRSRGQVESEVDLLIDVIAVVDVRPVVRESGFDL